MNSNTECMVGTVVDDLLEGFADVSMLEIAELLEDGGFLEEVDPEEWDDLTETVAQRVQEELCEIREGWRAGII